MEEISSSNNFHETLTKLIDKKYPVQNTRQIIKLYDPTENIFTIIKNPDNISLNYYQNKYEITSRQRPVKFHFILDYNKYSQRLDEIFIFVIDFLKNYLTDYSHVFFIFQEIPNFKKEDFCITICNNESIEIVFKNYFYLNNITSNNKLLFEMNRIRDDIFFQYKYTSINDNLLSISNNIQDINSLLHYIPNDHVRKSVCYYTRRELKKLF